MISPRWVWNQWLGVYCAHPRHPIDLARHDIVSDYVRRDLKFLRTGSHFDWFSGQQYAFCLVRTQSPKVVFSWDKCSCVELPQELHKANHSDLEKTPHKCLLKWNEIINHVSIFCRRALSKDFPKIIALLHFHVGQNHQATNSIFLAAKPSFIKFHWPRSLVGMETHLTGSNKTLESQLCD